MNRKLYFSLGLVLTIVLMANLVSDQFHMRLDLTEDGQYTLSKATRDLIKGLDEPVTVKAYFSQNLPANVAKARRDFQEMLIEYANLSDGMLLYSFVDPNKDETTEQDAQQSGIRPVIINVREKDQVKQQKAYLGATVSMGDQSEVIPFIQPGSSMEYALSTAIKKISVKDKPVVGFIQGHGEPSLSDLSQLKQQLDVLHDCEEVRLDSAAALAKINTLVLIAPTDTIPDADLAALSRFLSRGGHLAVAINRVEGDFQNSYGYAVNTGLEKWLAKMGIDVEPDFVVDAKCAQVTLVQHQGGMQFQQQIPFPFLPIAAKFADHPITKGLESVMFKFASSVHYTGDTTRRFTPLVFSSDLSNALKAPQYFDVQKQWTEDDLPEQGIAMAAAIEGKLVADQESKMVVIGDGDFAVSGPSDQGQQLYGDNANLMSNTIDWLSDNTGLIGLRTKGATSRPIRELEDSTKALLKYGNFLFPIVLILIYGLIRAQRNKMLRLRRMGEDYEKG